MKSRKYMRSKEFKARQMWLDFGCAVSTALRCVADSVENFRKWFKAWKPKKQQEKTTNKAKWLWPELIAIQQTFKAFAPQG